MALSKEEQAELASTSGGVKNLKEKFEGLAEQFAHMNLLLVAVVIVLLVGFATAFVTVWGLVLDATRFKTETYQSLIDKIDSQTNTLRIENAAIDSLTAKITNLNYKINQVKLP